MDQIILTGFMGAGKTTVGQVLSELTNIAHTDIDSEIIEEQGCPVTEIFEKHGEQGFRDLEHQKLKEVIQRKAIISTGGGIVLRPENREVLKAFSPVVYLKTDPAVFLARLEGDTTRPLVQEKTPDEIRAIFEPRIKLYEETADLIIETDELNQEEVAEAILKALGLN
ncbi:shikimate kinase [Carnobacterium gallinarum]|uniref:shikimate kinase n=1 Tax=Carnobacterium gallinarum TaxID=2749 RepID=UPI0009FBFC13|nr:shikimate kinase [Carnobacterium gallinarum]